MARIICIANLKGGVGKSVTTVNLAYELAMEGADVLVVDMDKQGNTTKFYGHHDYDAPTVGDVLLGEDIGHVVKRCLAAEEHAPGSIWLLPSNMSIINAARRVQFDQLHASHDRLARALRGQVYEYVLIDCPPDIDIGVINALCAADDLILPADCGQWAIDGIKEMLEQVSELQEGLNPRLAVMGILMTKARRTKACQKAMEDIQALGVPVFDTVIPQKTFIQSCTERREPLGLYGENEYTRLANEIQDKIQDAYIRERGEEA